MKLKDFDFRIWNKKENKYIKKDYYIGFKFDLELLEPKDRK